MTGLSKLYKNEQGYMALLKDILESGVNIPDRTGVGSRAIFDAKIVYDVSEVFPFSTVRPAPLRLAFEEFWFFLNGKTQTKELEEKGCYFWKGNTTREFLDSRGLYDLPEGDMGKAYGYSFRRLYQPQETVTLIKKREDKHKDFEYPYNEEFFEPIPQKHNSDDAWVIEKTDKHLKVQFKSGYVGDVDYSTWSTNKGKMKKRDLYEKSVQGVGFLGNYDKNHPHHKKLLKLWESLFRKCYGKYSMHENYSDVSVSPIWHSYEMFQKTIIDVIGYHEWLEDNTLEIDKDYFGARVYSPNTCIFLSKQHNYELNGEVVLVNGVMYPSKGEFCRITGTNRSIWEAWRNGKTYKGISAPHDLHPKAPDGYLYRRKIFTDQLEEINNELTKTPYSRRLLTTFWIPSNKDFGALTPCHHSHQFVVLPDSEGNDTLHLKLINRSLDASFGLLFAVQQYALYLICMANLHGFKVGKLSVDLTHVHIYNNQMDFVKETLQREYGKSGSIELNKELRTLDDLLSLDFSDFLIKGLEVNTKKFNTPRPPMAV